MTSKSRSINVDDDDIVLRVVRQEDSEQVRKILLKYFYNDEPLTGSTAPIGHVDAEEEDFMMANIQHGTCVAAVLKQTGQLVGVCMAGPQAPDEADHLFAEAAKHPHSKWGKILRFLACIERDAEVSKRYNVQKIVLIISTCVKSSMRGRNLGARLYNAVRDLAKAKGYELLRADCSSHYSARIKEQLNWDCVNTVYYKDYRDENNQLVFNPPEPHVCCKSYALRL